MSGVSSDFIKASVVFVEVVRDTVSSGSPGHYEWDVDNQIWKEIAGTTITHDFAEDLRRTAYHELMHQFIDGNHNVPQDDTQAVDQGIMNYAVIANGSANGISLYLKQLAEVRDTIKPTDS